MHRLTAPDESLLRVVLESLFDGVAAVDKSGAVLFINDAMGRLLGIAKASEALDLNLIQALATIKAVDPDGHELAQDERPLLRALRGEAVVDAALRMHQPSRSYDILNSALPIFDEAGAVRMAVLRMRDVTDQRRAMEALQQSEERYHLAMSAIEAMVYDWDIATGIVSRSEAIETIVGCRPPEQRNALRDWWLDRVHPHDVDMLLARRQAQFDARAERELVEYRVKHADGHWVDVVDRAFCLYDAAGKPARVVGSVVDVMREKKAVAALRESEQKFAKAFQIVPVALAISSLQEGRYLDVNSALLALTGYQRDEVIQHTARELDIYEDAESFRRMREHIAGGLPLEGIEMRLRDKAGDIRTALMSADVLDIAGEACLLTATVDITERKGAEKALAESEQRYRALFENASDIVAILDPQMRVISINSAVEQILGYDPQEVLGKPLASLLVDGSDQDMKAGTFELRVRGKDPRRQVDLEVRANTLEDMHGQPVGLHVIARDITERKLADKRQTILVRELQHRTKNILAVVQSLVTNTLRNSHSLAQAHEALVGRLHAIATAQEFVTADGGGGAPLHVLVEGEVAAFPGRTTIDGPALIVSNAFAQTFTLVVHELVTNAAKYGALSSQDGRVDIRWALAPSDAGEEFQFSWIEHGGPPVTIPRSAGFGRKIIGLLGQPTLQFMPEGLRYRVSVPASELRPDHEQRD